MKINIEGQTLTFENKKENISKILTDIENIIDKSEKVFSHMVIDSVKVYSDFREYLESHISEIKKVEIVLQTYKELVNGVLFSAWEYVDKIPAKIDQLAKSFYQNPDNSSWRNLNDLLTGIEWVLNTFTKIDQDIRLREVIPSYEIWNLYAKSIYNLRELLPGIEQALTNKDYILLADTLSYELTPVINDLSDKLSELQTMEVM